jgi:phytoene/squalene synthetase
MKELEVYAENTRSLLLYLNLHLLRIDDKNALSAASHLGRCIGICDVLKKIPFYLAKNRSYMPNELLLKVILRFLIVYSIIYISIKFGTQEEKESFKRNSLMLF